MRKYGGVIRFYQIFGREAVLVADPEAVRHILVTNSLNYQRPQSPFIMEIAAEGLIMLEGEKHRRERKMLNPCLNAIMVKGMIVVIIVII